MNDSKLKKQIEDYASDLKMRYGERESSYAGGMKKGR